MKGKYYKSNYALNRNKKAIVYENADGTILEITFEKIAAGNPNFTEEDFEKLKEFSDQLYLEEQRGDVTYHKHVKGCIDEMDDSAWLAIDSFEDELINSLEDESTGKVIRDYMDAKLTEVQRRRFLMFLNGVSTTKIAEIEGCNQNAAWESIQGARKKLKKFLKMTGRKGFKRI